MRKLKAAATVICVLAIVLFFAAVGNRRLDRFENAWAYADPPLMKVWAGEAAAGGVRMKLVISLERDEVDMLPQGDSNDSGRGFHGNAMFCDSTGRTQAYTLRGTVADRHAAALSMNFSPAAGETPGLRPGTLKAAWKGGDELDAHAWLAHALASRGTMTRSSDPLTGRAIEFTMRPAAELACSIKP